MADAHEIKQMLANRAQQVCEYLLPNGRKESNEWRVGSTAGEKGGSLGVHLSGNKAGVWADFADSARGGDLIDLWAEVKGLTIAEAFREIEKWLGVETQKPFREPKKEYKRPPRPKCQKPNGKVQAYLCEARKIPVSVIDAYKVGERGDEMIFPFLLPDGELALAKARKAEDGASPKPTAAECEPVLFGWQAVPGNARELVIAEGEIDALSWAAYGVVGMSVPFGGGGKGKQNWIENEFERLQRFDKIYVAMDMDEVGDAAAAEIVSRLGRHRCYRVETPRKDANKCLQDGVTQDEMLACLTNAKTLDPEGLRAPSDLVDNVIHLFWPAEGEHIGYDFPHDDRLTFRPAEITLWSGASGAGKSQILSDCIPYWVQKGSRICVASLEMKGEQTLKRLTKQTGAVDRPTAQFITRILSWLDQGLLLYDRVGKAGVEPLLEVFDYARAKYGCDQFIIDSLMRLGIAGDDYNGQEKAVYQIVDWAISRNVHVHLVAHARKAGKDNGGGAPETEDIKGAMEIGANAFNIVTVWRNRKLEDKIKNAKSEEEYEMLKDSPGVVANIAKQRNGDYEGKVSLWFDQETYRYHKTGNKLEWHKQFIERETRVAAE